MKDSQLSKLYDCAFPNTFHDGERNANIVVPGLSKREWFAGMAFQGLCARYGPANREVAEMAIKSADALIERLNGYEPENVYSLGNGRSDQ